MARFRDSKEFIRINPVGNTLLSDGINYLSSYLSILLLTILRFLNSFYCEFGVTSLQFFHSVLKILRITYTGRSTLELEVSLFLSTDNWTSY